MKRMIRSSLFPALALLAGIAAAQPGPGPMGPGMMGGYGPGYGMGPGMMGGYGSGWGMGPGMMGGYGSGWGMGPGMMGGYGPGYGMGPGMRGGYGPGHHMGPGMTGGYGMGPGMMGSGAGRAMWLPGLTDSQRSELAKIHDESRSKQWEIAGKMQDEMAKMRDAMTAGDKRDRAAISAAFDRMTALRKQRLETALDAADRVDQVLTAEQREQLRRWHRWGPIEGGGRP